MGCCQSLPVRPDYQMLYLRTFNRLTDGIALLQSIQQEAEALYIEQTRPASLVLSPDFSHHTTTNNMIAKRSGTIMNHQITEDNLEQAKSTGIVRKVDDLGRVVLPKELRKILDVDERDPLEIFVLGEYILLHKYVPACIFCGSEEGIDNHKGKKICSGCMAEIATKSISA